MWDIILSDEIDEWLQTLDNSSYDAILIKIAVLRNTGPSLGRPYVDTVEQSRYKNMKELRIQFKKHVFRVFFAFDPKRKAILLIGGDKRGNKKFYEKMIPLADKIFTRYLRG